MSPSYSFLRGGSSCSTPWTDGCLVFYLLVETQCPDPLTLPTDGSSRCADGLLQLHCQIECRTG
jgi:hypothetical protein